ncbi:MAG: class I SAM-dependent methyltransferase [Betaproteobacteria bacterium]|nr:class I SAM-dependent methyltransferase [Betaproteobacteria bacterium]NBY05360.1 class I SAM-dependent methyltransferase [Betaproteobacteria bacterium]
MNTSTATLRKPTSMPLAARQVLPLLQQLQVGQLQLRLPDGSESVYGPGEPFSACLVVHDWSVFGQAMRHGDIGFAESFIAGHWESPDLCALLRLMVANRNALDAVIYGRWWGQLAHRLRHWLNRNTRRNSRKNIHAHYDLGNTFYSLWLDQTLNYSSAWFDGNPMQSLSQAQDAKVRRALRMVNLKPGGQQRLLEIGCGWGALAEMSTREWGADFTGVTLSEQQLQHAQKRLTDLGLGERAQFRLQDYRDIQDPAYDAICSIEMIEAVGQAYWPIYFETVARLLKPGGRACIQSIVIADAYFDRYVRGTDFIQQYIFPGGCLPSPSAFRQHAQKAGLRIVDEFAFGQDYAHTLRVWRERFMQVKPQVLALGFDERFVRIWQFYLAYCEAAFLQANTDVVQYTLLKP